MWVEQRIDGVCWKIEVAPCNRSDLSHAGPLTSRQIFRFSEEGLVNARFDYSYNNFRVTSMQAVINETPLPIDLYRYVDVSGRVEQFGKFSVIFYDLNQVRLILWVFLFSSARDNSV